MGMLRVMWAGCPVVSPAASARDTVEGREGLPSPPSCFFPPSKLHRGKREWGVRWGSRPALSDSGTDSSPGPHRKSGMGAFTPSGKGGQDPFLTFQLSQERQKQNL